jgi:hypothetical protein
MPPPSPCRCRGPAGSDMTPMWTFLPAHFVKLDPDQANRKLGVAADNAHDCVMLPCMQLLLTPDLIDSLPTTPANQPRMPDPVLALASARSFSFDRRDQLSASAIQRARLAGSRFASCLHSRIREFSSKRLVMGAPASGSIYSVNLRQVWFPDYCPKGHCPNGHMILTEPIRCISST